jgi:hypothetical protein
VDSPLTFSIIFVLFPWTNRCGCFKLNWMSDSQAGINVVDQILRKVDRADIQDERARECIRVLLNLIESLTAELRKAHAENLYLREQLHRRTGGGGQPERSKDSSAPVAPSSEKETKPHSKRCKLERVRIDREEVLRVDRASLAPLPARYRGEFGPHRKSLGVLFSHLCNMTEPKIADLLGNLGIVISHGQISAWLARVMLHRSPMVL